MIILATVSIFAVFGENGIINKTQKSKDLINVEQEKERLELAKGTALIENNGRITTDNYIEELIKEGIIKKEDAIKGADGSYQFTTDNGYNAKVEQDGEYNVIITIIDTIKTNDGAISFSDITWNNGSVSVKVNKNATNDFNMVYQVYDSKNNIKVNDTNIESGGTISGLELGDMIYVYFVNGSDKEADPATLQITDNAKPNVSHTITARYTQILLNLEATDNESGIKEYEYYIKKSSGSDTYELKNKGQDGNFVFTDLKQGEKYDVKFIVSDNAGNTTEGTINSIATNICAACSGTRIARINCGFCEGGTQYAQCQTCKGTGMVNGEECSTCNNNGYISCVLCGGIGSYEQSVEHQCTTCNGAGRLEETCYLCSGSGITHNTCTNCGGSGYTGEMESCVTCGGSGMADETCTACFGLGYTSTECGTCMGSGTYTLSEMISCPNCNGQGRLTCPDCNGKSAEGTSTTCTTCSGSGKVENGKCNYCAGKGYTESECTACKGM